MAFAISAPRSAWRALLWKDFQQIKQAVLVITLGLMGIQALSLLIAPWLSAPGRQDYFPLDVLIGIATVAPVVCILASIGMLIGQERQTGSWGWSSCLPQSWRQALASKTLVSLSACVLPLIPLSLIPLLVWIAGYPSMNDSGALPIAGMAMAGMAMIFATYMAVYLAIGVLIFREPLTGLVVGSIVSVIGPYLMLACIAVLLSLVGYTRTDLQMDWLVFALLSVTFVAASIAMVRLFRWRWSYGMTAALPSFWFSALTTWTGVSLHTASRGFYQRSPASEFRMLLTHAFNATWGWLLLCLVLNLLLVLPWFRPTSMLKLLPGAVVATAALWGIATFAGDQSAGRFRFWADRGVSPYKLVTSKILLAVLTQGALVLLGISLSILVLIGSLRISFPMMLTMTAVTALTGYFLGALSSLCFRSSVMALGVCLLSICCCALLYMTVISVGYFPKDIYPDWFYLSALWMTPTAVSVGFVALYWLARKWLVQDSPRLERHYAWIFPALASLPVLVPIAFGFLLLPNVPWQGSDYAPRLTQPSPKAWPELPQLKLLELPAESRTPYGLILHPNRPTFEQNTLERVIRDFATEQKKTWEQPLGPERFTDELEQLRTDLDHRPAQPSLDGDSPRNYERRERYYDTMYATALMGNFLAKQGQIELAQLAWTDNKQLLETAGQLESDAIDLRAWIFSSLVMKDMLAKMDDEQRTEFGSDEEFRANIDLVRSKTIKALRNNASYLRQQLRAPLRDEEAAASYPWIIRVIPTLRWRQERSLAIEWDNAIAIVCGKRIDGAVGAGLKQFVESWLSLQ